MANFDVFDVLPEVPVTEQWDYLTDILKSYNGTEQRIALRVNPRVQMEMRYNALSPTQRRSMYHTLTRAMVTAYAVPQFQYAAPLTADAASGQARVFFDNSLSNIRAGQEAVLYNALTGATEKFTVLTVETDGATFSTNLANAQAAGQVVCVPSPSASVSPSANINFGAAAGDATLRTQTIEIWDVLRPNHAASLTTFDSLTLLDKTFLNKTGEVFNYRREWLDGDTGKIVQKSRDNYLQVNRALEFESSRSAGDLDYWRLLFNTQRGGQVSFLLSTQLPDLTLTSTPAPAATSLLIEEGTVYATYMFPNGAFKRVALEYSDGTATSYHVVNAADATSITLATGISSTSISKISFLQRVRADDTIRFDHYQDVTAVKFKVTTVEN